MSSQSNPSTSTVNKTMEHNAMDLIIGKDYSLQDGKVSKDETI